MIDRQFAARILIAVGILGVLSGLGGIVIGQLLVTSTDDALGSSLVLTGETVDALQDAILVAEQTVALVEGGLAQAETTTGDLAGTVSDGATLLRSTADITEGQLADSLGAFEDSLPGLIDAAAVIDVTLSALSGLPFGPTYSPEEPFDESLRELQASLDGVPEDLRAQGALIRATGDSLDEVGAGTTAIADDLGEIREGLAEALVVLQRSTETATDARSLVADTQASIGGQLLLARVLVVLLGLTVAAGQIVPLAIGWTLLRPAGERVLLRQTGVSAPPSAPTSGARGPGGGSGSRPVGR